MRQRSGWPTGIRTTPISEPLPAPPAWLSDWLGGQVAPEAALARYDALAPVVPADLNGTWAGTVLRTGHPFEPALAGIGWAGKRFDGPEEVHPLLTGGPGAGPATWRGLDPARLPVRLALRWPGLASHPAALWAARRVLPALATRHPAARLRQVQTRGRLDTAMIYDRQPIIDTFRRIDAGRLLGLMDLRGQAQPLFFLLERFPA